MRRRRVRNLTGSSSHMFTKRLVLTMDSSCHKASTASTAALDVLAITTLQMTKASAPASRIWYSSVLSLLNSLSVCSLSCLAREMEEKMESRAAEEGEALAAVVDMGIVFCRRNGKKFFFVVQFFLFEKKLPFSIFVSLNPFLEARRKAAPRRPPAGGFIFPSNMRSSYVGSIARGDSRIDCGGSWGDGRAVELWRRGMFRWT